MSSVTYKSQPGIDKTKGNVPIEGTEYPYRVSKLLWPSQVELFIGSILEPPTLHICCGMSKLGDVRLDIDPIHRPNVLSDAAFIPFGDKSFNTVLCDPPYNGNFRWMHDMLNEMHRVCANLLIFQHWFSPVNESGQFKKAHVYELEDMVNVTEDVNSDFFLLEDMRNWMPRTYFGRMQIISIFRRRKRLAEMSELEFRREVQGEWKKVT